MKKYLYFDTSIIFAQAYQFCVSTARERHCAVSTILLLRVQPLYCKRHIQFPPLFEVKSAVTFLESFKLVWKKG